MRHEFSNSYKICKTLHPEKYLIIQPKNFFIIGLRKFLVRVIKEFVLLNRRCFVFLRFDLIELILQMMQLNFYVLTVLNIYSTIVNIFYWKLNN